MEAPLTLLRSLVLVVNTFTGDVVPCTISWFSIGVVCCCYKGCCYLEGELGAKLLGVLWTVLLGPYGGEATLGLTRAAVGVAVGEREMVAWLTTVSLSRSRCRRSETEIPF